MAAVKHWMADQVVYEIFPDRFAIGQSYVSETKLQLPAYHRAVDYVRRGWDELPVNPSWGKDFFGGDLLGIVDHLDHLQELGATSIFLTPIFYAPSNHKYDATDFFTVDEQFGGEQGLGELVRRAHKDGIRLILDAALNHASDIHPWFLAAKKGEEPYRNFFTFEPDGRYRCWRDFRQMPEMNLSDRGLQDILYRNGDSVLQKYLALKVDGWRFDAATDLGLQVAESLRRELCGSFTDAALIGEVSNFGGDWVKGDRHFHGLMNYYFRGAVLSWLRGKISARQVNLAAEEYYRGYGDSGAACSWNILSSHDTPRLKHMLPEPASRKLAIVAQFTLPGVPLIYYGEEIGMDGGPDPDCRRPMVWDREKWNMDTFALYKRLVAIRRSCPELRRGKLLVLGHKLDSNALVFVRHTDVPKEASLVVINSARDRLKERLFLPYSHFYDGLPMRNLLAPDEPVVHMGQGFIDLDVPEQCAAILVPADDQYREYKFFKERILP